ncbi:hypothetical protein BCV63_06215 [Cylindrospermopsis raciborskii CS-508]|nr:hypothetical protein BCV63_06215 [Cylindrospermopsis raciborskii CS-508]
MLFKVRYPNVKVADWYAKISVRFTRKINKMTPALVSWWQWELSVEDQQQVSIALELTQLKKLGDRPVEQLSGGERQRVQNNRIYVVDYYGFINAGSIDSIQKSCEKLKQILSKTIDY